VKSENVIKLQSLVERQQFLYGNIREKFMYCLCNGSLNLQYANFPYKYTKFMLIIDSLLPESSTGETYSSRESIIIIIIIYSSTRR
jgi:hypothetical protein